MWQTQETEGEEKQELEGKWGLGRDLQIPGQGRVSYHQSINPSLHQSINSSSSYLLLESE